MSRRKLLGVPGLLWALAALGCAATAGAADHPIAIVIHGGAGVIERSKMTPEREASYRAGLAAALDAGYTVLEQGGSSLDAVIAADGFAVLDAAIMDGNGPRAGAVAAVRHVKNPIELARLVMDKSPHVLLVSEGAEEFALQQGVVLVPESYFIVPRRVQELEEAKRAEALRARAPPVKGTGTVGAIALDRAGNLAAGTSTGGLTNKHRGRVGDSPIIGAGTYDNNESCAVSGTGQGEFYIRQVLAYDICAMVYYQHKTLAQAVHEEMHEKLKRTGGEGGVIAMDPSGNIVMDLNSPGMFRGARDSAGRREIGMYGDMQ